jgi:hypothetical protein
MLANLFVVLIVLGCAAYTYQKSSLVKSFATLIIVICSCIAAFGYFEAAAKLLNGSGSQSQLPAAMVPWMQPLCFGLIFIIVFALLQTCLVQLDKKPVSFPFPAERVGRIICGLIMGLFVSGSVLAAIVLAPLPASYPYGRFEAQNVNPEEPSRVLMNADGFVSGFFAMVSSGSMSGRQSFAALHPSFVDQAFLNRLGADSKVSLVTSPDAIELQKNAEGKVVAVWPAPEGLTDSEGKQIPGKSGCTLMIVRAGIRRIAMETAGRFMLSQMRLICQEKGASEALGGKTENAYAIGYITTGNKLRMKKLNEVISLSNAQFKGDATARWIDFGFYVPNDRFPILLEFMQNNVQSVPSAASAESAPALEPLEDESETKREPDGQPTPSPDDKTTRERRPKRR